MAILLLQPLHCRITGVNHHAWLKGVYSKCDLFSEVPGMEPKALFVRGRHATTQLRSVLRILSLFGSIQGAEVPDSRSAGDWLTCPQPKYPLPCCALGVSHEQSGQCFPLGPAGVFRQRVHGRKEQVRCCCMQFREGGPKPSEIIYASKCHIRIQP